MTKLLLDYDPLLYSAASVGEKKTIKVVHRQSGDEYEFDNRTAFWGHHKKKAGGYLALWNASKESPRQPEEFEIIDIQTPEPISNSIHILKTTIKGLTEALDVKSYYGYSGKGKVFREDVSTVLRYKGNRVNSLRPLHLDDLKDYLVKFHACEIVTEIEADDACSIDCYDAWQKWKKTKSDKDKLILSFVDKDYLQCAGHLYNTNEADGICSYDGFGWLGLNDKGEVKGRGRLWLLQQVLDGDSSDNYFANSASELKWAAKSAYNLLKDAKTDKEAFQAVVDGYNTLYPAPKKIIGWRGYDEKGVLLPNHKDFEIEVDAMYMLQENFTLAKMLRWRGDKTDVREVLDKLGVNIGN